MIEYQGEQHFIAKTKFGGQKGLLKQKFNDEKKKKYCMVHDIKLICIPYWDEYIMDYDYIMKAAYDW